MRKVIQDGDTRIVITSNNQWVPIEYIRNDDEDDEEAYVPTIKIGGKYTSLNRFMRIDYKRCRDWEKEFTGVLGILWFYGIYIKISADGDYVQVYRVHQ